MKILIVISFAFIKLLFLSEVRPLWLCAHQNKQTHMKITTNAYRIAATALAVVASQLTAEEEAASPSPALSVSWNPSLENSA